MEKKTITGFGQNSLISLSSKDKEKINILDLMVKELHDSGDIDNLIIKGGWLLKNLYGSNRETTDVDAYFRNMKDSHWTNIQETLIRFFKENDITDYKFKNSDEISENSYRVKFKFDSKTYGLDISPKNDFTSYDEEYIIGLNLKVYTREQVLMDKISSVLSNRIFRRTKDLFDIYFLLKEDINLIDLLDVSELERYSKIDYEENYPFKEEILSKIEHAYDKLKINENNSGKPEFNNIILNISTFLDLFISSKLIGRDLQSLNGVYWKGSDSGWER